MIILLSLLALGLVFLGLNWVSNKVEDAFSALSAKLSIPATVAGATLLAIGGSAGEFFTSLNAAVIFGVFEIGLVTIIWSAIFNLCVITGCVGLVTKKPITVAPRGMLRDFVAYVLAALLLILAVQDGMISRMEGFIFLGFYVAYLVVLFWKKSTHPDEKVDHFSLPNWHITVAAIGGLAAIGALSWAMIEAGLALAGAVGLSIAAVSALVFAFGTSISDTFIAVSAAKKGNGSGAISSIFGSNTFDIAVCLGLPIVIVGDTVVDAAAVTSSLWMLIGSIIVVGFFVMNDSKITRTEAWISLALFGGLLTAFLLGV